MRVPFFFVDVFTDAPLTGNPLAVVPDAESLDVATMQAMAREFNQSETTFVLPPTRAGATFRLRCYTPTGFEAFGAGHNALGAWWWIADAGRKVELQDGSNRFHQELGDRVLPVEIVAEGGKPVGIVMTQSPPKFGAVQQDRVALAAALRLAEVDLGNLPAQVVSTGAPHMLVELRNRDTIARARPDSDQLRAIMLAAGGQGCYLFSLDPENRESTAHARFFNPVAGISEDPATGSAAGPLAAYLVKNALSDGQRVVVEQGYSLGRPSRIEVRVQGDLVEILGRGVVSAEGFLKL